MENVSEIIVEFIIVLLEFRWKDLIFSLDLMVSIAVQVLLKVQVLLNAQVLMVLLSNLYLFYLILVDLLLQVK